MKRPAPVIVAVRLRLPPIEATTEAELLRKVGEMIARTPLPALEKQGNPLLTPGG